MDHDDGGCRGERAAETGSAVTRLDHHHLQSWYSLRQSRSADLTVTLDRFRLRHPEVFAHICNTDTEAAGIAVQHGWELHDEAHSLRSPDEVSHARSTVAATLVAIAAAKIPHP